MRRSRRIAALLSVALLTGALVATGGPARAQQELNIDEGFFLAELPQAQGAPADGIRFYAPELNVHQGDQLNINLNGFHNAFYLPEGEDAETWLQANSIGIGKPFSLVVPDPDDTALDQTGSSPDRESLKGNNAVVFPTHFDCGTGAAPCSYDGTVLNSGLPLTETPIFSATVDTAPGSSFWIVCIVHPSMRLKVNVVEDTETASTQADVDAYHDSQTVTDAVAARQTHRDFVDRHRKRNGVWQAWTGIDGDGYSLLAMYPRKLTIKKGQRVRYNFDLPNEIHTASLPLDKARNIANTENFVAACDPDGDAGPGPDGPPENEATICNDITQVELDITPRAAYETGNGTFNRSDFESSGVRGAMIGNEVSDWTLRFAKKSPKKGFKYLCIIHPFMRGTVVVKKR
jgi:hypothetical protein